MFDQQGVGSDPGRDTCYINFGEVVLSALPARLRIDDTQAYIRMDCKGINPVSALGVHMGNSTVTRATVYGVLFHTPGSSY